jgi:hypothetical protein
LVGTSLRDLFIALIAEAISAISVTGSRAAGYCVSNSLRGAQVLPCLSCYEECCNFLWCGFGHFMLRTLFVSPVAYKLNRPRMPTVGKDLWVDLL